MNCFTHEGAAAVGVCGNCGKGVCRNCTVDLGFKLVCSEKCNELARNSHALELSVERTWGIRGGKLKTPGWIVCVGIVGTLMLCFAIYNFLVMQRSDWFGATAGSAFLIFALLSYRGSRGPER
jgi:hypothetical protein